MDHEEHYNLICGPAFKRLEEGNREILELLRGSDEKRGLIDRVRKLEDEQGEQSATIQGHHHVLFGEGKDKSGLVDDMRQQEKRQERAAKVNFHDVPMEPLASVITKIYALVIAAFAWVGHSLAQSEVAFTGADDLPNSTRPALYTPRPSMSSRGIGQRTNLSMRSK